MPCGFAPIAQLGYISACRRPRSYAWCRLILKVPWRSESQLKRCSRCTPTGTIRLSMKKTVPSGEPVVVMRLGMGRLAALSCKSHVCYHTLCGCPADHSCSAEAICSQSFLARHVMRLCCRWCPSNAWWRRLSSRRFSLGTYACDKRTGREQT